MILEIHKLFFEFGNDLAECLYILLTHSQHSRLYLR